MVAKKDADKCFGASLMREPELVGECLRRMKEAVDAPVTLKHRMGVRDSETSMDDSTDSYDFISRFVETVHELSGVEHFIVHARCAVLGGLSPAANRTVPPLRYGEVHRLADDFPALGFSLNGGVDTLAAAEHHLASGYRLPLVATHVISCPFHSPETRAQHALVDVASMIWRTLGGGRCAGS